MILTIKFKNHKGEDTTFDWTLVDTRYAKEWKSLMLNWKSTWIDGPKFKDKWFISASHDDFIRCVNLIKQLVDRIDSLGQHYVGSSKIDENITQEELNRIHEEFHKYVEKCEKNSLIPEIRETEELCHRLNDLVHLTEISEKNRKQENPEKRIIATALPHMQVDYDESDYDHYVSTKCAGWIYVGYATPGKSLYHCFSDNDTEVVKHQMVRQSQGISNEIHIELTGKQEIDLTEEARTRELYYKWCEVNDVVKYGYSFKLPIYRPGRLPLAKPNGDINTLIKFFDWKEGLIVDFHIT